jgi:hypothetical protein
MPKVDVLATTQVGMEQICDLSGVAAMPKVNLGIRHRPGKMQGF